MSAVLCDCSLVRYCFRSATAMRSKLLFRFQNSLLEFNSVQSVVSGNIFGQ